MAKIKLRQVDGISRKKAADAYDSFMRHCKLKNLAPYSILYYEKNIQFFLDSLPQVKYVNEINQEQIAGFINMLMDRGNRVTAINARLRGAFVFLRYCFEQEYLDPFPLSLIKEDEPFKEPYTDAELKKLLRQPQSESWTEWRAWAVINLLVATGNRASTVVNIKICDVDFEHNIIRLRKLKNRKQQFVPMSSSLNEALSLYLKVWDWDNDEVINYAIPGTYIEERGIIVFKMQDAFKNTQNTTA
ncbi:MAG: tyrosine-type recombinase/integrase [Clostridia bacterium]|nr:tyrosine-type recombinase/integrase [Clostridia bacterium]